MESWEECDRSVDLKIKINTEAHSDIFEDFVTVGFLV